MPKENALPQKHEKTTTAQGRISASEHRNLVFQKNGRFRIAKEENCITQ